MRKLSYGIVLLFLSLLAADNGWAAELDAPQNATAGNPVTITLGGSGSGTLCVLGPFHVSKHHVALGQQYTIAASELHEAGRYTLILKSGDGNASRPLWVAPGAVENISFLAQPSRVPASARDAIGGTAFVFDHYYNLVLKPTTVKFDLTVAGAPSENRAVNAKDGIAWVRMNSGKKAGAAQFVASAGDVSVRRVVQQTAADPCNLRMTMQRTSTGILVETDPIRDCSGNPVPDGTIVTFTETGSNGHSAVDAPIKKGIARAEFPPVADGRISVASGVVLGNEIRVGGGGQ